MTAPQLSPRGSSVCRGCGAGNLQSILDLGSQPLANRLLPSPDAADPTYPLHLRICHQCGLGQVGEFVTPSDIFQDYPYLSSMSASWLEHVARFGVQMRAELTLGTDDLVLEIASNDGHLLKEFRHDGIKVLGVEPAANVAAMANAAGIPTECSFFGLDTAKRVRSEHGTPRLVVANNVLAHVPDLDDFVSGLAELCGPDTIITIENPSFTELLVQGQFDTIYHEHFSYLTAHSVGAMARKHGLELVRVELLSTHGGSNRYWLRAISSVTPDESVGSVVAHETAAGLFEPRRWRDFARMSQAAISGLSTWLRRRAHAGAAVAAYGAAAKGNTFLNAVGEPASTIAFVVDASPEKQGRFLPGSHIPVLAPEALRTRPVDDVLILPWNIADELRASICVRARHSRIWVALPEMRQLR